MINITNENSVFNSVSELSIVVAQTKKRAKQVEGNSIVVL